ncbi:hypothetical protein KY289_013614 [Solanum tuberosum]|nr:hypothetical protein KY289_013614 [Solanum tuberosum]
MVECAYGILKPCLRSNYKDSTKMAETGQRPGREQIYISTHKNKDRVYVKEAAKEICKACGPVPLTTHVLTCTRNPSDAASEPIPPMNTRRSCGGDSNPSHANR